MTDHEKKKKAAIATVLQYISQEQQVSIRAEPLPPNIPTNWSFYSRQIIMINRNQMQRRVVKR